MSEPFKEAKAGDPEPEGGPVVVEERRQAAHFKALLEEKEVLLREVHHRVKNNLQIICSLLNLQAAYVRDPEALAMFQESQNRVRLMAAIHDALYRSRNLSQLDAGEFLSDVTDNLLRVQGGGEKLRIAVGVDGVAMAMDLAVPCGLIVNELVSASLKHALASGASALIRVELRRSSEGQYVLEVSDDGEPFLGVDRWRDGGSLGWQLVETLTKQLDGQLEVRADGRARCTVTFPERR
jgi:two-component sensor histidine kinase